VHTRVHFKLSAINNEHCHLKKLELPDSETVSVTDCEFSKHAFVNVSQHEK